MGENSKIEWCDHTFNPWTGCTKVSDGCAHCYAETWAKRTSVVKWGENGTRRRTTDANWKEPRKWHRAAEDNGTRPRVFCASLADVFEDRAELEPWRAELFELIDETPRLTWLLLTKRPQNIARMMPTFRTNVWLGTSVEDQATANLRIGPLLYVPATVHFLSMEPLLGPVHFLNLQPTDCPGQIDWVIAGGESGQRARPCYTSWITTIQQQCAWRGIACFVKQLGSYRVWDTGQKWDELPNVTGKGGNWDEWPEYLRQREFPS